MRDVMLATPKSSSMCFFFAPPTVGELAGSAGYCKALFGSLPYCRQCLKYLNLAADGARSAVPQSQSSRTYQKWISAGSRTAQQ